MQLGPLLMIGVCERLAPWAGPLESVVSTYEKVFLVVTMLGKRYLALTINKADAGILGDLITALSELET